MFYDRKFAGFASLEKEEGIARLAGQRLGLGNLGCRGMPRDEEARQRQGGLRGINRMENRKRAFRGPG
jgi:hypothetical protein